MKYNSPYTKEPVEISLAIEHYRNGNLAIMMYEPTEEGYLEPFASTTVNLDQKLPENEAYLDDSNVANIEDFFLENELGEWTGKIRSSGFCTYPLYKFDMEKLKGVCEK